MKKNDWLILAATAVYTILFYNQFTGVNFFLFSLVLIILTIVRDINCIKQTSWLLSAIGTLTSGFAVFYYGTTLAVIANVFSLTLLTAFSFSPSSSLFISLANAVHTFMVTPPSIISRLFSRDEVLEDYENPKPKKFILFMVPVFITFMFFFLYRESNPLFAKVTDQVDLSFISIGLIFFTVCGAVLMYGFFYQHAATSLTEADERNTDKLSFISEEEHGQTLFASYISLPTELFIGLSLFIMLNLLLLAVNSIDIYYIYILQYLPYGLSLSAYVHDGTNALIVSIIFAIGIILFYFRGHLNFSDKNKPFRYLTYAWVAQNIFMVITTANRNFFYISSYGLTHKRIGVYIFLGLCIFGLVTAFIKVALVKSNWFLFRKNTWAWYLTLVISCFINWDNLIATHNLELAYKTNKAPDPFYLDDLDHTALATLFQSYERFELKGEGKKYFSEPLMRQMNIRYGALYTEVNAPWQSSCLNKIESKKIIDDIVKRKGLPPF